VQVAERCVAVGWWPERSRDVGSDEGAESLALEYVFPSGRAAIAQALQALDLPDNAAIAMEPHGSDCLTRVVRRYGTPVDICEADASAAVVYEQWGWPLTDTASDELNERFRGRPMVLDRVDSADFFVQPRGGVEVLSLSKLLGLDGGGLARANGCLVSFEPRPESDVMRRLRSRPLATLAGTGYRELFKESRQAVHPAALAWLHRNCLTRAVEDERSARQRHLQLILDSRLAVGWPAWMRDVIGVGAGPVWAPVLRGQDAARRWRAMSMLEQRYGVVSASRLFNWSGNPLRLDYEFCLALPVHGGVTEFGGIVAALEYCLRRTRDAAADESL